MVRLWPRRREEEAGAGQVSRFIDLLMGAGCGGLCTFSVIALVAYLGSKGEKK